MVANVREHTGYTLDDFLSLPLERSTALIEMLMDKSIRKNHADKKALEDLSNGIKQI